MLHRTEYISELPKKHSSRSEQWPQVRKHVLEDGVGHPGEVSWIEIYLEGEGLDTSRRRTTPLTYSGKTLFADMRRWYRFLALKVDMMVGRQGAVVAYALVALGSWKIGR